jgi:hypothetical protein
VPRPPDVDLATGVMRSDIVPVAWSGRQRIDDDERPENRALSLKCHNARRLRTIPPDAVS